MNSLDIGLLEQALKLMKQYQVDEIACEMFTIKKSRHEPERAEQTPQEILEPHLQSLPDEPWATIPEDAIQAWSTGVKE